MAKRRRRSYRDYVQIPGLSAIPGVNSSVKGMDVLVGAGAGVLGAELVKMAADKLNLTSKLPEALAPFLPSLTSAAAGFALYYGQKQSARATGHLVGALAASVAAAVPPVKAKLGFSDVVSLRLSQYAGRYGGVLVDENTPAIGPGAYGGLVVDEPQRAMSDANLAALAQMSMGDDNDGMAALMGED